MSTCLYNFIDNWQLKMILLWSLLVHLPGKELWAVVSSALALARQNPTPFVSAVRIVEREEALDQALLEERAEGRGPGRPLPPGRPRCWRERFFQVHSLTQDPPHSQSCSNSLILTQLVPPQVLQEAVSARFRSVSYLHTRGPGLAGHLSALQHAIMADLATVRHLLEHCVPPHYRLAEAYLKASHRCLHTHLVQVCSTLPQAKEMIRCFRCSSIFATNDFHPPLIHAGYLINSAKEGVVGLSEVMVVDDE